MILLVIFRMMLLREAFRGRSFEQREPENLDHYMEFDSFVLSGGCAAILHKPLRVVVPDLLCVSGYGTSAVPDLSHFTQLPLCS